MLASTLLDYLTVLRWPLVVGAFLIFFFLRYNAHVGRLIDRIQSVSGPMGTGARFATPHEQEAPDEDAAATLVDEQTELVEQVIEHVRQEYELELVKAQLQSEQVTEHLLRQLATTELRAEFEFVYGRIYGSQIAALRTMRATPEGAHRVSVEAHLSQTKALYPEIAFIQNLSFDDWFGFLQYNDLAEVGVDGLHRITQKGSGFLAYIEGLSYPGRLF